MVAQGPKSGRRWRLYAAVLLGLGVLDLASAVLTMTLLNSDGLTDWLEEIADLPARGWGWWRDVALLGGGVLLAQAIFLFPVRKPMLTPVRDAHRRRSVRASLAIAGLAVALLVTAGLLALSEMLGNFEDIVDALEGPTRANPLVALWLMIIVQWIGFAVLVMAFIAPDRRERMLGRLAAALFLGTTLETLAIIPVDVMVRRRDDCYCATGTFISVICLSAVGTCAMGPILIIPLLHRRRKRFYACRCDVCRRDMRDQMDADQCPSCGAGWAAGRPWQEARRCRCGHDFAGDYQTTTCPECQATRYLAPLLLQLLACDQCGYDMRGDLRASVCPE
ncbi:MAG: hypothetical protein KDA21_10010, partial [Phycisphaerales bacterium]|nr:hypothetical protein [Phycisphaerales bacterium]